jgi:hypothetical protein
MGIDQIKIIYTYSIASILILGGLFIIYQTRLDPPEADIQGLRLLMAGFIGGATQFVFNRETQTQTARQVERSTAAGVSSQPTVTTSGNPPTTTVTPASPEPSGLTGADVRP